MDRMATWLWWGKICTTGIVSIFFLMFGIETLMGSYSLNNPLEFIMYFFSSNLIILISLVGIIYSVVRIHLFIKAKKNL